MLLYSIVLVHFTCTAAPLTWPHTCPLPTPAILTCPVPAQLRICHLKLPINCTRGLSQHLCHVACWCGRSTLGTLRGQLPSARGTEGCPNMPVLHTDITYAFIPSMRLTAPESSASGARLAWSYRQCYTGPILATAQLKQQVVCILYICAVGQDTLKLLLEANRPSRPSLRRSQLGVLNCDRDHDGELGPSRLHLRL